MGTRRISSTSTDSTTGIGHEPGKRPLPHLGPRQADALDFIAISLSESREYPSVSELAGRLKVSRARAWKLIKELREKGYLKRVPDETARNIEITPAAWEKLSAKRLSIARIGGGR